MSLIEKINSNNLKLLFDINTLLISFFDFK